MVVLMAALFARPHCAWAYAPSTTINSVTGGPDLFTVNTITNAALTSSTITVNLGYSTTGAGSGGTFSVAAPATLAGTGGNTLDTRDFSVQCTSPGNPTLFASAGIVPMNGTTQCGTLPAGNHNVTVNITVAITLDTTLSAIAPFLADTYASTAFTVSATAT